MPTSSDTSRGRSSSRRLPPELASLDRRIQQRFQQLRESIRIAEPARLRVAEHRAIQRAILGDVLGLSPGEVAAIESSRDGVPASILLSLMQHYGLSAQFFLVEGLPPSPSFLYEQQQRELQGLLTELRAAASAAPRPSPRPSQAEPPRKGGWLKGLPRTPKTPEQLALRDLWKQARDQGFTPPTLEALLEWGRQHGIEVPEPAPVKAKRSRPRKSKTSRGARRRSPVRKGGWLKGLPRTPKTPEQFQIRRIWEEARSRGLGFSSLEDLKIWWGQAQPTPESQPTAEASTPRPTRAPGRKTRKSQPSPAPETEESAEDENKMVRPSGRED